MDYITLFKIGIPKAVMLLVSNSVLLYLFITEKNNNKNLLSAIDKTNQDFNQVISNEQYLLSLTQCNLYRIFSIKNKCLTII